MPCSYQAEAVVPTGGGGRGSTTATTSDGAQVSPGGPVEHLYSLGVRDADEHLVGPRAKGGTARLAVARHPQGGGGPGSGGGQAGLRWTRHL